MRIRFLGTGGPDGFHRGGAGEFHERARQLGGRNWRRPSVLYIAPDSLIDFSRVGPTQLKLWGIDRDRIENLLITHSHDDHFDPQTIATELARPGGLRQVYGNEVVCRKLHRVMKERGLHLESAVHLLEPFHEVDVGRLRVIPVKANHCWLSEDNEPETALNFIVQSPDASLLYLVDTRLMYQETHEFIRNFTYDAVILDTGFGDMAASDMSESTGHSNFEQGRGIMQSLERDGLFRPKARRIFSHLSTAHADLYDNLAPLVRKWGYILSYDGMRLSLGGGRRSARHPERRRAHWIWHPRQENMKNSYLYARKRVVLEKPPERAPLVCTCRGAYQLYVNGRFFGRGPSPCDPRWQYCDRYDIAPALKAGENVIALLGYSLGKDTECATLQNPGEPGLYVRGRIECEGRKPIPVLSDQTWRVKRSGAWAVSVSRLNHWIGYREVFDTKREDDGWKEPGYDDFKWIMPDIVDANSGLGDVRLIEREIPVLEEKEVLPRAIFRVDRNMGFVRNAEALLRAKGKTTAVVGSAAPGAYPAVVLDFGREVVGYPVVSIGQNEGGTCIFSYGETLDLRNYDRLVLSGKPVEWSPFGRRAFRYLQMTVTGGPQPIEVKKLALRSVSFPVKHRGSFRCSDPLLDRVWKAGRDTVHLCMQDHYEDCPTREQSLWIGDVLPESRVAYYAFGETGLTRKCLLQEARVQTPEGWIPAVGPVQSKTLIPNFCAYWVTILHEYYLHSGDLDLLKELYPNLDRLMTWFSRQEDSHHLLHPGNRVGTNWWCFVDWAPVDRRGEVTALQCAYYKALLDAAAICDALGKRAKAASHRTRAGVVRKAVNERLWDDCRVYMDCRTRSLWSKSMSVPTNALALLCGVAPTERARKVLRYLSEDSRVIPAGTPFMTAFYAEALFHYGKDADAIKLMRKYWGEMLRRGATTFWEGFDPRTPRTSIPLSYDDSYNMNSLCHGWSGGPTHLLPAYVLGVRPISAGFREFLVAPQPGNLTWAEGKVPTPHGEIALRWERDKRNTSMRIKLEFANPCRARLELSLPAGGGPPRLNRVPLHAGSLNREIIPGVHYLRRMKDRLLFRIVRGGSYELTLTA